MVAIGRAQINEYESEIILIILSNILSLIVIQIKNKIDFFTFYFVYMSQATNYKGLCGRDRSKQTKEKKNPNHGFSRE